MKMQVSNLVFVHHRNYQFSNQEFCLRSQTRAWVASHEGLFARVTYFIAARGGKVGKKGKKAELHNSYNNNLMLYRFSLTWFSSLKNFILSASLEWWVDVRSSCLSNEGSPGGPGEKEKRIRGKITSGMSLHCYYRLEYLCTLSGIRTSHNAAFWWSGAGTGACILPTGCELVSNRCRSPRQTWA